MLNTKEKANEIINNYKSYTKNKYEELKKQSEELFEISYYDAKKCIFIKNEYLKKSYEMQKFYSDFNKSDIKDYNFYKVLELNKLYFNLSNLRLVNQKLNLNENFNIHVYCDKNDGPDLFIIRENDEYTLFLDDYCSCRYKISKNCLLYILEKIIFYITSV